MASLSEKYIVVCDCGNTPRKICITGSSEERCNSCPQLSNDNYCSAFNILLAGSKGRINRCNECKRGVESSSKMVFKKSN